MATESTSMVTMGAIGNESLVAGVALSDTVYVAPSGETGLLGVTGPLSPFFFHTALKTFASCS